MMCAEYAEHEQGFQNKCHIVMKCLCSQQSECRYYMVHEYEESAEMIEHDRPVCRVYVYSLPGCTACMLSTCSVSKA